MNGNKLHAPYFNTESRSDASDDQKAVALVMASRLIDAEFQFNGTRTNAVQGLQWPRAKCPEPDNVHVPLSVLLPIPYDYVQYDTMPKSVVQATCEMARELLVADRTAAPVGEGLKYYNQSGTQTGYDKTDRRPVISPVAQALLAKYGSLLKSKSGAVRLVRG